MNPLGRGVGREVSSRRAVCVLVGVVLAHTEEHHMKAPVLIALSTLLALAAGLSHAQGKTREAVKAELAEAVRMGDIPLLDNGLTPRDLNPSAYPARPVPVGKTREQVVAELIEAKRMGDYPLFENGQAPREVNPSAYPARATPAGKTRAEVLSELAKAIRMGDIPLMDNGMTPREANPRAYPAR